MGTGSIALNWADYTIIGIVLVSTLISIARGFIREALSLVTWVIAFWVAFKFAGQVSPMLIQYISSETIRFVASFALLMVGALIVGAIANYLIGFLVNKTGLSGTDRLLGIIFGVVRGIFLVGVLLLIAQLSNLQKETWWTKSNLIPQFGDLVHWMEGFVPKQMASLSNAVETSGMVPVGKFKDEIKQPVNGGE